MVQHAGPQFVVEHLLLYLRILERVPGQAEEAAIPETEIRRPAVQHRPCMYLVSLHVCHISSFSESEVSSNFQQHPSLCAGVLACVHER